MAQRLKRLPLMWETCIRLLGQEDPLEKEMATHSSILAWYLPCIFLNNLHSLSHLSSLEPSMGATLLRSPFPKQKTGFGR